MAQVLLWRRENEITRVTTATNTDNTSSQAVKVDNAVDEEQPINHLSSNCHILNSSHSHSVNGSSEHSSVIHTSTYQLSIGTNPVCAQMCIMFQ